ncbi:hypothetical protein A3L04_10800 [Thermococcus chitonophagus]|uniref:Uncharacterized protein PF0367 n=1 Tax=Thermococcus chitonophagus TaxID=54262 RepID=A0A160VUA5_9EURY|nr:hypothetical protein [Thermococcus chitonophagus]ASJ17520.1 hypothetical protein A3L04_10800 [Thermococcus chitonophagus]CUX78176.1 Uncharacterized protein PF0367 [Thermococcus chitonophagus]
MFSKEDIEGLVVQIRREHGLPVTPFEIDEVRYDKEEDKMFIIAHDRTDKSVIIGSSLVIGKLKEILGVKMVSVYTTLDLTLKKMQLEESLKFAEEYGLDFLVPFIKAEFNFPPRKWPSRKESVKGLVFLSFNAKALLGFADAFGIESQVYGVRYSFPKLSFTPVDRPVREIFFPDEEFLESLVEDEEIIFSEFTFPAKFDKVALINPIRFLRIGYFELKYLFGESRPAVFNKVDLVDYVVKMVSEGLMEATDGARIIRWGWKR